MKKTKTLLPLLLVFWLANMSVQAQGNKIPIAIIGFALAPNAAVKNQGDVVTLQDIVTSEFVSRSRFLMLDRSKFDAVLKELKVQKTEEFLDSKVVAQGRMIGAKYIVTGVVSEFDATVTTTPKQVPVDFNKPAGPYKTIYESTTSARINFSFQVIDVEKGSAIYAKAMSGSSTSVGKGDMDKAICQVKREVKNSILSLFPNEMHIIKLETVDKKGRAEKVLIDEGGESFSENSGKPDACGSEIAKTFKNIFTKKRGTPLVVYEIEKLTVNGKEIIREKTVGKVEVDKVEGETSVCTVKDGEKEIADRFNAGAVLLVKPS